MFRRRFRSARERLFPEFPRRPTPLGRIRSLLPASTPCSKQNWSRVAALSCVDMIETPTLTSHGMLRMRREVKKALYPAHFDRDRSVGFGVESESPKKK